MAKHYSRKKEHTKRETGRILAIGISLVFILSLTFYSYSLSHFGNQSLSGDVVFDNSHPNVRGTAVVEREFANIITTVFRSLTGYVTYYNSSGILSGGVKAPLTSNINLSSYYSNLTGYYSFDENFSNISDISNNSRTGTGINVAFVSGVYGNAVNFDGKDSSIEVSYPLTRPTTLSFWVKTTGVNMGISQFDQNGFRTDVYPDALFSVDNNGNISVYLSAGSLMCGSSFVGQKINDNSWHLITGVLSGSGTSIYVDGKLSNSVPQSIVSGSKSYFSMGYGHLMDFWTGYGWANCFPIANPWFNGSIDDYMMFNMTLNSSQISEIYNNQSKRFIPSTVRSATAFSLTNFTDSVANVSVAELGTLLGSNVSATVGYKFNNSEPIWNYTGSIYSYPILVNGKYVFSNISYPNGATSLLPTFNFTAGVNNFYSAYISTYSDINITTYNRLSIAPSISFIPPTLDGNITGNNALTINITFLTGSIKNATIYLFNSSKQLINVSNSTNSPFNSTFNLQDGIYFFNATVYDNLGLANSTETRNVTIDTFYPSVSIIYPLSTTYPNFPSELNYTASDPHLQTCWYSKDLGVTNTIITCSQNVSGLSASNGNNIWTLYANDSVGHTNSISVAFTVNIVPLSVILNSPLNISYRSSSINVNLTLNKDGSSVLYSLNNGLTNISMSTSDNRNYNATLSGLVDGSHTLRIYANDTFGSRNDTTFLIFSTDTVPPRVTIINPGNTTYFNPNVPVNIGLNEAGSCIYSVDNGLTNNSMSANSSNTGFSAIFAAQSDGSYTLRAYCNDSAGNFNSSSLTFSISSSVSSCTTLSSPGITYTLSQNISSAGVCLKIAADNITIDGNGFSIIGDVNASGNSSHVNGYTDLTINNVLINGGVFADGVNDFNLGPGVGGDLAILNSVTGVVSSVGSSDINNGFQSGHGGNVLFINSSATIVTNYGGDGLDTGGANGGSVTVTNSNVTTINNYGGYADCGAGDATGGSGGSVTVTNSNVTAINNYGGSTTPNCNSLLDGGNGGSVTVTNSAASVINSSGGSGLHNNGLGGNAIFINSNIDLSSVSIDLSSSPFSLSGILTLNQTLIYNNFGSIAFGLISSRNTSLRSILDIGNNLTSINSAYSDYNKSANVTLLNLQTDFVDPVILKDGFLCLECNNFTSLNAGSVLFNVLSGGNYSIGSLPSTEVFTTLNSGWNLFALTFNDSTSGSDVEVPVSAGWNLLGYSGDAPTAHDSLKFTQQGGSEQDWNTSVVSGKVRNTFAYYDSSAGNKKFKFAPYDDSALRSRKGYWVYSDTAGNITFRGAGGSRTNDTYAWKDLLFRDENTKQIKNITDAAAASWVQSKLYYYDPLTQQYGTICGSTNFPFGCGKTSFSSWQGVFAYGLKDNITMIRHH